MATYPLRKDDETMDRWKAASIELGYGTFVDFLTDCVERRLQPATAQAVTIRPLAGPTGPLGGKVFRGPDPKVKTK